MIAIFRQIIVLFDTLLHILRNMGIKKRDAITIRNKIEKLEDAVDNQEKDNNAK